MAYKARYTKYLGIFQGMRERFTEFNRIIAKVEQADEYATYLRVLRDIFSKEEEKREFSTMVIKQKLNIDNIVSDIFKEAARDLEGMHILGKKILCK